MKIEILKEDIMPYVYFVCSIAYESESGMHGALGSKNDFIGGIFDRWINIIPESIIFNKKILLDVSKRIYEETGEKYKIKVFSDFFKYKPNVVGIAPDVLGVEANNRIIPFVKYDDTRENKNFWVPQDNCPQIEVKSFKESQYLVSLRNQNYDNKYLVMVETNLSVDYLLPFFDSKIFEKKVYLKLKVPNDFIESNENNHLVPTNEILEPHKLGYLELLLITNASELMANSTKCYRGESPRYVKEITKRKAGLKKTEIDKPISDFFNQLENGLYRENDEFRKLFNNPTVKTLDIYIENSSNIIILKANKNNIIIKANENAKINTFELVKGDLYSIDFSILDRSTATGEIAFESDAGSEYFFDKKLLNFIKDESESLLLDIKNKILEKEQENGNYK